MSISTIQSILADPLLIVLWTAGILILILILLICSMPESNAGKWFFFGLIGLITIGVTAHLIVGTARLISHSPSKGPVHWHADFLIYQCGKRIDLVDPQGLSNRVGTPLVHEHGDNRIHIEGIPETAEVASLKHFFESIGGYLDTEMLRIPTNNGVVEMKNGDRCKEDKEEAGELQVFLWQTKNVVAKQIKIEQFKDYVIAPETLVPPGDCVIFEFDTVKNRTEYLCEQYTVAERRGDITILR